MLMGEVDGKRNAELEAWDDKAEEPAVTDVFSHSGLERHGRKLWRVVAAYGVNTP